MNPLSIFEDNDKLLIGALLFLLWKQNADRDLLLALLLILLV